MSIFYDFVEIGTSDFDTLIERADSSTVGLSIDPVDEYLSRLPSPANCRKLCAAISNYDGSIDLYHIPSDRLRRYGLPDWIKGCNSVGSPHPTVVQFLRDRNLPPDLVNVSTVRVLKLAGALKLNDSAGVYLLKIDAEGHDATILDAFFSTCSENQYPHQLMFEANILGGRNAIHRCIAKLICVGYDIVSASTAGTGGDVHLRLIIQRIDRRTRFVGPWSGYYLGGYPETYDPERPMHANTFEDAQRQCRLLNGGGITYQNERYEVRNGPYLEPYQSDRHTKSWVMLP